MKSSTPLCITLFICLFVCLFVPAPLFAKPAPPTELYKIFNELAEFEEKLEDSQWTQALVQAKEIEELFMTIQPVLNRERPEPTSSFIRSLRDMEEALQAKQMERTHEDYIALQRLVLDIMDGFDYKIHPVMFVIKTDLDEAAEGVEEGDFTEVINEINEVIDKFAKAKSILEENGASPKVTTLFADKLAHTLKAAKDHNVQTTRIEMSELLKIFSALELSFVAR